MQQSSPNKLCLFNYHKYFIYLFHRRSSVESELARTKLDMMSRDSQLMEAIQQKVTLSQKLDQWQASSEPVLLHDALLLVGVVRTIYVQSYVLENKCAAPIYRAHDLPL